MRRILLVVPLAIATVLPITPALARTQGTSKPAVSRSVASPIPTPDWMTEVNQDKAWTGYTVATAGDVNGDGYADVIVGTYRWDNAQPNAGRADAYYGSPTGLSTTPNWTAEGDQDGEWFGHSVSTAGDVNGDGYADVIVGAPNPTHGTTLGMAFVYYGSATGLSPTADWVVQDTQPVSWFGRRVSTAGDVNGDGYSDVIVGAPYYDGPEVNEGRSFAYYGSPTGLSTTANWTAANDQKESLFGRDGKTAGDVNGDGYADVIVGAHFYDGHLQNEGAAYAYYGSPSGLSPTPDWLVPGGQRVSWFGRSVASAGDVNADGYADVIVGAPKYTNDQIHEGRAFIFFGSAAGLSLTANWTAEADQSGAWYGRSVQTAGDVNGDGYADVIVGAPNYDFLVSDAGREFVYYGGPTGVRLKPSWKATGDEDHGWFGRSVATAGDVNGDGYADVITGAPQYDDGEIDEGAAFAFYGSVNGL
jgi:hypothetical protein